jgi:hypothetical protein
MSEEILSNEERNAILGQVLAKPDHNEVSTPKKSGAISESKSDLSQASFGELLERTIEIRDQLNLEEKETDKRIDESRESAIRNSRMDILKDWKL